MTEYIRSCFRNQFASAYFAPYSFQDFVGNDFGDSLHGVGKEHSKLFSGKEKQNSDFFSLWPRLMVSVKPTAARSVITN